MYSWALELCPLSYGHRHVFFRIASGALLVVSFTSGTYMTTHSGRQVRFTGLYAALSDDEGDSFLVLKPLVAENSAPKHFPTLDGKIWLMTNTTAEPEGYLTARQGGDGMIHVLSSRLSYHFTESWIRQPPPDAPDAPSPSPPMPTPAPLHGTWFTKREDWRMHSRTAKRTIVAIRNTR